MSDIFTHTFKFELKNPVSSIVGQAEFNKDGRASFKLEETSNPLPLETMDYFKRLVDLLKEITENNGQIKKILIKEKE